MNSTIKIACIAFAALVCTNTVNAKKPEQGLKDAYKGYFSIGVAVNQRNISDPQQTALILKEFNSITSENDMKPGEIHPGRGVWNFEKADKVANFCREHHIKLRGHNLCWHSQFCNWMFTSPDGTPATKEQVYAELKDHIFTVVNRYKDIVYCWDVVNEAMSDSPTGNPFRDSRMYKLCGHDFIDSCFVWAHQADPKALLFYNDYNASQTHKRDHIYDMVKAMKDKGIPIDGIGMQGHYNVVYGTQNMAEQVDSAITMYSKVVKHIQFTEVDIRANEQMGGQLMFSRDAAPITDEIKAKLTQSYANLFQVLRKHKKVVDVVTFWNLSDKDSWLGTRNYPLLFDENLQPKAAYYAVRDFKKLKK